MPLYECENCHTIDNTALTNFWDAFIHKKPKLCSACDPEIGKWHDNFPRLTMAEYREKYPVGAREVEYPVETNAAAEDKGER
jgi:hypothetical protein